ncbi:alpha/beta fold hydrolase [Actinomadura rudentiformis]|uniref:Alpha/beta hydrolase n=1 Tax=Actinomadura rudentiformis TaxID=359158 RepID=A0A6H9YLF9_9ACTN|nr:alpha/beta hydrolase [Actinomadura rudentiformis]KAB2342100.1 alpha/beta hydrolase [Actinomadura rudentiformis]
MTPTPGITLENVDGEQVHLVTSGPADGPPLLLSSGLGGAWFDWQPSVDLLEGRCRVYNFDRPGLGLSPLAASPPSLRRDVTILAGLAERAGAPVIVVAHSVAGFHAEALARLHPDLVRGLVLVDPSCESEPHARVRLAALLDPAAKALGAAMGFTRLSKVVGPAGRRLVMRCTSDRGEPVPAETVRSVYGRGTVLGTVLSEEFAYREMAEDLFRLRERRPFPAIPLVVLTALGDPGQSEDERENWRAGHRRLAEMSPYGRQVVLPGTRHMVQLDRPEAVAEAVTAVLDGPAPPTRQTAREES